MNKEKWFEIILKIIIGAGILVATINLFQNRSLWYDEAMLSLNIINKSFFELHKPLGMDQVAPIGFLYIQKLFSTVFGNRDWALRIFPFLAFLFSIFLYFKLCIKLTGSKKFALLACALYSTSPTLIEYSSEAKQYSVDVLVAIFIVWSTLLFLSSRNKMRVLWYSLVGVVSVWFSNIAVVILFVVGIYSLYAIFIVNRKDIHRIIIPGFSWLVSFSVYYALFIYDHPTRETMVEYWQTNNAFVPQNIFKSEFYIFLIDKGRMLFGSLLSIASLWLIPFLLIVIGVFSNLNRRKLLILTLLPLIVHLLLSYFKLYPFDLRLILYLAPFIILLYTTGIFAVYSYVNEKAVKLSVFILLIPVAVNLIQLARKLPVEKEEIKKSLEHINRNVVPGDNLYVYYASKPAFLFYRNNYPNINGDTSITFGTRSRDEWLQYDQEIRSIGKSTWLVFSHTYLEENEEGLREEDYILKRLKNKGWNVINKKSFKGSSVYKIEK